MEKFNQTQPSLAKAWAHTWAHGGLATRIAAPTARPPSEPTSLPCFGIFLETFFNENIRFCPASFGGRQEQRSKEIRS